MTVLPIIMAGGTGSRLWPLSREQYPKQFLSVAGDETMLQQTFARLSSIDHMPPIVICNEGHRFVAAEQIRVGGYEHSGLILEPAARNTAPAIALAALHAANVCDDDPLLLVLAADHLIRNDEAFGQSVTSALELANDGKLTTFGIVPDAPETGYGYIKKGDECGEGFVVSQFVEKPDLDTAKVYLESGDYLWNSGMFLFKASTYLSELSTHRPDILQSCKQAMAGISTDYDFIRVDKEAFENCPEDSIDYAVMEKTTQSVVVPMDAGWNDVGSWSAIWEVSEKDAQQNVIDGDVVAVKSSGNYLSATNKLVATVGVNNLIVVETKDAVLVADRNQVQDVKSVVSELKKQARYETKHHRDVYRPWGKYDSLDSGVRDQVKRLTVKPGARIMLQKHHHRAEHWVVVSGTAEVTIGDETFLLTENQSTYIPVGGKHAISNPGKMPLEVIEVRTGSYINEDDIVRFESHE